MLLLLNLGLFIPMGWGAPQGSALVVRNSVSIVPNVAGEVIEVPVEREYAAEGRRCAVSRSTRRLIDSQVKALEAQLKLSRTRLSQMTQLFERDSGRGFDVEQRQSEVDQLKAQLEGAQWNLDKTVVRAPADGYVTNVALRKGARVANLPLAPVMAFIDTSDTIVGVEISQNDARYIAPGQPAEVTFKSMPGAGLHRQGRERSAGARDRTGADVRAGGDAEGDCSRRRSSSASGSMTQTCASACRPAAPATPRSSPITSRSPTSSARCCCGRLRS